MKSKFAIIKIYIYILCMLIMIFDAQMTIAAGKEGIVLCLYTVIPSLFPFIFISILINNSASYIYFHVLNPMGKLLQIPKGNENIIISGFVGGYPLGAQAIKSAWLSGTLSKQSAQRMLAFCSNAGPAFIFGMSAGLFPSSACAWLLWGIHILAAIITSYLFPETKDPGHEVQPVRAPNAEPHILTAVKSMASICGWIIIARIVLAYSEKYLLKHLPYTLTILLSGCTELSNGVIALEEIPNLGLRFILFSGFIGFGGICVLLQTRTATETLGLGCYFPGKIMHCLISVGVTSVLQYYIFDKPYHIPYPILTFMFLILSIFVLRNYMIKKKIVAFSEEVMYNDKKATEQGDRPCYFEKNTPGFAIIANTEQNLRMD